jgi:hypothetical protein
VYHKKTVINANATAKKWSAKKVIKQHIAQNFTKETVNAKFKARYNDGKINQTISVDLHLTKDKEIWLRGKKLITLFKAKITPNSVAFYSPLKRIYFEGDFKLIEDFLGTKINFKQMQNLFLGQSILDLKTQKYLIDIVNNLYVLAPENQNNLFDAFTYINPKHFKVDKQILENTVKQQQLTLTYPNYKLVDKELFPEVIRINAKQLKKTTLVDFNLKSVEFNTKLKHTFKIPQGYKRITL